MSRMGGKVTMEELPEKLDPRDVRLARFGVWFMLFCALITGLWGGLDYLRHKMPLPDKERLFSTDGTRIHRITLAGQDYFVPQNYILMPYSKTGMVIEILLPDMEPRTDENKKLFKLLNWGNTRASHIHFQDATKTTTLAFKYGVRIKHYPEQKELPDEYGLKKRFVSRYEKTVKNERLRYIFEENFYTETDKDGNMVSFIECSHLAPAPGCKHSFNHENLEISVSYSMDHLPEWKTIAQKTIDLIDSFKTLPPVEGDVK